MGAESVEPQISAYETKEMVQGLCGPLWAVQAGRKSVEEANEFRYLGNDIANSGCGDKGAEHDTHSAQVP